MKDENEWMFQAGYDLHAAEKMFDAGVYTYTVFMCHLSIEKALKSVYVLKLKEEPPKTHDILLLSKIINWQAGDELHAFIRNFSSVSVQARYPRDLKAVLKEYDKNKTGMLLENTKKVLKCLRELSDLK